MNNLNIMYTNSKNAWMTNDIFKVWLYDLNEKMLLQNRKILLILDNAPCHNVNSFSSIEIMFDQAGLFYDYNEIQKCWIAVSKAKLQILADDGVSQRGFFQAFIICNLIDRNKSIKYEVNEQTVYNGVESTPNSIYWSLTDVLCAGKSGAFKFDKENCVQDLKNILN